MYSTDRHDLKLGLLLCVLYVLCVCSLPAVALTLGRSNWPLLKETYETLANDMQWKVSKRVLRFYIL
jgi:hypothetical protein